MTAELRRLIDRLAPARALPGWLTTDPDLYRLELDRIWAGGWLFACHAVEVGRPGDVVTLEVGAWPLIVVRGDDQGVRAFHNVCRHRGMRLVEPPGGRARSLVCPYHQWSYGLDGGLRGCGGMDRAEGLDRDALPLRPVRAEVVGGLVFVALGPQPPGFSEARDELGQALAPQGLARARVAAERSWTVAANWKVVWENNRECWHCVHRHPTYVRANYDTVLDGDGPGQARLRARLAELDLRLRESGLAVQTRGGGLHPFPSPGRWWAANRTALVPGFVTESGDGQPVAPVMGTYASREVGTLRLRMLPNFWCHASSDHAVTTRLLPRDPGRTEVRVQWLVDRDARAGIDYDEGRLTQFWLATSEEDWALCEAVQLGMRSPAYEPGPLSRRWEANVIALHDWYREAIGRGTGDPPRLAAGSG